MFLDSKKKQRLIRVTVVVAVVGLVLSVAGSLLTALAAEAHTTIKTISPQDGGSATSAPEQVRLEFTEEVSATFAAVTVTGVDGVSATEGAAVVDGAVVTQALAAGLGSGAYAVTYRVVAADGHPITGTSSFTLDLPPAVQEPASPTATATGDGSATGDGTGTGSDATGSTPQEPTGSSTGEQPEAGGSATLVESDGDTVPDGSLPVLLGGGALVLVALGIVLLMARRRQAPEGGPGAGNDDD